MARVSPMYDLSASMHTEELVRAVAEATTEALERGGAFQRKLVDYLKVEAEENHGATLRVNEELAEGIRTAIVEAYNERVVAVRAAPPYARDHRYSGKLLRALKSKSMAVASSSGIEFINTALLDSSAAQWARLNFGAEPNIGHTVGASSAPSARIRFGSGQGRSIRLIEGPGQRVVVPDFGAGGQAPYGYFNESNQLVLGNPEQRASRAKGASVDDSVPILRAVPSKVGIGARHFLDQGLVNMADNFGPAWKEFFVDAKRRAVDRMRRERIEAGGRDFQAEYRARIVRGDTKAGH